MPVRRATDPLYVQYVWDGIKFCVQQKQLADLGRIVRFVQKCANCSQTQAELCVKQCLQDELIVEVKKISQKGGIIGNEVDTYRINKQEDLQTPPDDGHDWYCFECHLAGDVIPCNKCYRVFHTECSTNARQKQTLFPKKNHISNGESTSSNNENKSNENLSDPVKPEEEEQQNGNDTKDNKINENDYIYDESLCSVCNMADSDPGSGLEIEEFNYLLNFILHRIRSWVPERLSSILSLEPKYEWYTPQEMSWRAGQLFYQHMDMSLIEMKLRTKQFTNFSQFQADVYAILHNVAIFHGVESQEYGAAELMIRDMTYDISELQNCVDCYKHSNEKINDKWFCLPCRIPHKLVWAKQKGYPYWPAKVIRETDTNCDVRFFSGKYERSVLPKNCLKPITTSLSQLHVKKTATFNKALEELHLHQKLLENPAEIDKVLSMVPKKPKKSSPKNPRRSEPYRAQNASLQKKRKSMPSSDDVYEFHDSPTDYAKGKEDNKIERKRKRSIQSDDGSKGKKTPVSSPIKMPTPVATPTKEPNDVIQLSDLDEESFRVPNTEFMDSGQELVTSSTELMRDDIYNVKEGTDSGMQKLEQPYSDAVEKMRRKLETSKDKKQLIQIAMDCMQAETDRIINEHNEALKRLFESHNAQISETKKKQWCYNCEQDAIYHCCWNTAYCSPTCQQQHWLAEHKKVCRRKR